MNDFRIEKDALGEKSIAKDCLWGIHTSRAIENFNVSSLKIPSALVFAYAEIKLACARTNHRLGYLPLEIFQSIEKACLELIDGNFHDSIVVDAFQGGAGTSTNLNICEVIANRALILMGKKPGEYEFCDPLLHVNLHQSTNDTYPSALKIAAYRKLKLLEFEITKLQEICQTKEKEFSGVLKIARTELMDAIPMTMGRTFSAWAEAFSRDRWRIFKSLERIRVLNLGGTAIGTGLGAPREYIFAVNEEIRIITGFPLARAENMVDATQNHDLLLETMGFIKTHASNLLKISSDLRLLNMGPEAGIAEIELPAVQIGSSMMPNKYNPVIPEMLGQIAIQIMGYEQSIAFSIGSGQLELNPYLPLVAFNLLESLDMLIKADKIACEKCLTGLKVNVAKCKENVEKSYALITLLIPIIGYYQAAEVSQYMKKHHCSLKEAVKEVTVITEQDLERITNPQSVNSLGFSKEIYNK